MTQLIEMEINELEIPKDMSRTNLDNLSCLSYINDFF